jgi:hypothetical protein
MLDSFFLYTLPHDSSRNLGYQVYFSMESAPGPVAGVYGIAKLTIFAKSAVLWHSLLLWI